MAHPNSPTSPALPRTRSQRLRHGWTALAAVTLLTLAVYLCFALTIDSETSGAHARDAYYNRLADGLREGHVWMDKPAPAALKALPNPYDRVANGPARGMTYTSTFIHDLSYYHGRLYMYFSVVPAVLVFLPYRVLTGHYLSQQVATAGLAGLAFLAGGLLLVLIWRRFYPKVSATDVALCILALGLASTAPSLMQRPDVYEVPIAGAYLFALLAIGCIWQMADESKSLVKWATLLSIAIGGEIGCRPSEIPATALLLVPLAIAWWRTRNGPRRAAALSAVFLGTILPVLAIGLSLLWFNYARFGNPVEFGFTYHLSGDPPGLKMFSIRNLGYNLFMYFVNFPGLSAHFPFAGPWKSALPKPPTVASVEHPLGLITTSPFVLCAAAIPFQWKRIAPRLRLVVVALAWLVATNAVLLCLFFGSIARYEMAFAPELVLLAAIGVFGLEAGTPPLSARRMLKVLWIAALVFSVLYDVLIAVRGRGSEYAIKGTALLIGAHDVNACLAEYHRALTLDPDDVAVRRIVATLDVDLGRSDHAIDQYHRILASAPNDAGALSALGGLLAGGGGDQRAEALQYINRALQIAPNLAQAHANLAALLASDPSQRARAVAECRTALRLDPALVAPKRLLRLLGASIDERTDAAIAAARERLAHAGSAAEQFQLHEQIAELEQREQNDEGVIREFEAMLRLKPDDAQIENNLGAYLARDPSRTAEAIAHLRAAIRLAPNFAEAHNNLGVLLARNPELRGEAIAQYKAALAIRPDYAQARQNFRALLAQPATPTKP